MSDFIKIDPSDMRALERNHASVERYQRGGMMNAVFVSVKNRAIDGQVVQFNVPFPYKNSIVMIEPGAFGDLDQQPVSFCIDHKLSTEAATTDDALLLVVDGDAIQFRLDLERAAGGVVIARMCEVGDRAAMSVGCDIITEALRQSPDMT